MKIRSTLLAASSLLLALTVSLAHADEAKEKKGGWTSGWRVGIGPVGGVPLNGECEDCTNSGAFGMDFRIGRMFTPKLQLLLDTHGAAIGRSDVGTYGIETTSVVQGVVAISAQYWPAEKFWLKAGIGHGQAEGVVTVIGVTGSVDLTAKDEGFGMIAATGYDFYEGRLLIIDASLMYAGIHAETKYRGNLLLGIGFNWKL